NVQDRADMAEDEYYVEKVVSKKVVNDEVLYTVKWQGYPSSQNTDEQIDNLLGSLESIKEFEKRKKAEGEKPEKGRKKKSSVNRKTDDETFVKEWNPNIRKMVDELKEDK